MFHTIITNPSGLEPCPRAGAFVRLTMLSDAEKEAGYDTGVYRVGQWQLTGHQYTDGALVELPDLSRFCSVEELEEVTDPDRIHYTPLEAFLANRGNYADNWATK